MSGYRPDARLFFSTVPPSGVGTFAPMVFPVIPFGFCNPRFAHSLEIGRKKDACLKMSPFLPDLNRFRAYMQGISSSSP